MEEGKKRLAVLVGCNYFNTKFELHGCINDVKSMCKLLTELFGFNPKDITVLKDVPGAHVMPTGANIGRALRSMVDRAKPGDVLFFHFSGHGTLLPVVKPHQGHSNFYEAIVPCDFNFITDVDFRLLVDRLPPGVSFTITSDSCNSGGLIDKEKKQIGPLSVRHRATAGHDGAAAGRHRARTIPSKEVLQHVASLSGIESEDIGDHLVRLFGHEASAKFSHPRHFHAGKPISPDNGILLSGCQTNERSAEAGPDEEGGKAYGAFSNSIQLVLQATKGRISNKELVLRARKLLGGQGFKQHPCLYCSDENADAPFLWQPEAI